MSTYADLPDSFIELHDPPPRGDADFQSSGESRSFIGPTDDLMAFLRAVAGTAVVISTGAGTALLQVPLQHPIVPGWYAQAVTWEGYGASTGGGTNGNVITHTFSKVTVNFRSWPLNFDPTKPWFAISLDFAGNFVTMPGTAYFFPDGTRVYQDVGRQVTEVAIQVIRYRVVNIDYLNQQILNLIDHTNSTPFALYNLAEGLILFGGARTELTETIDGTQTMMAQLNFNYSSIPHGSMFNPSSGGFELVRAYNASTGPLVYDRDDLNQLLIDPTG